MRAGDARALAAATLVAAVSIRAEAVVINQGAVAQTLIVIFAIFACLLFLVLLAVVAIVARQPHRRRQLRVALIAFPLASLAATIVLLAIQGAERFALLDDAMMYCTVFLIGTALVLAGHAFLASRRQPA